MIEKIEIYLMAVLMAACVLLGLAVKFYHDLYKATDLTLATQTAAIVAQKKAASDRLAELTAQVASTEAALAESGKKLKEQENDFNTKLNAMHFDSPSAPPVRVRVVPGSCGSGGGGASGKNAAAGPVRSSTPPAATGLLDPEVSASLRGLAVEVEGLQRDFNTCRADLLRRSEDGHDNSN